MNEKVLLSHLEELAEKLGILVRDENINIEESSSAGGRGFKSHRPRQKIKGSQLNSGSLFVWIIIPTCTTRDL